jgi:hypothetical protein
MSIVMFFKKGLMDSSLIRKLAMKNPMTLEEMFAIANTYALCHTRFLSQNRMLIVCVPRDQVYTHTVQKIDTE